MIDPHGKSVIYHYDGLSRVDEITDRNHRTRNFSYDINDNLLTEAWSNGVRLTYTYDKVSNLLTSTDSSSNTINSYDYDEIYQLTDKTTGNTKFHYNYDVYGDLTQRQDWVNNSQIATIDYTYNKNHQLTYLHQTGTGVVATDIGFSYDRLNQLTQINRKSANDLGHLVTDYQYDAVGLVADINSYFNTTANTISHYHYGYDAGNRLILTTGTDGNSAVNYGNDNQLTGVTKSSGANESYNFDALGIRSGWSTVAGDSRQVFNDGTYEYQYDDEGNLSRKKELLTGNLTNYSWDYRNRLVRVTSGAQTVEYGYDASDKRVSKKINGVVTEKYVYDGTDIALVVDGAGVLVERYLFGAGVDNVLSREKNGAVVWSLGERQGSVVDLVDEHGVVLNHFVYDGFGSRTGSSGAEFRFGYTGREKDGETGLYYYRARYYDPKVGRFISEDPIGFAAGDTNLYRYVGNNSTNYTDPSGEIAPLLAAAWGVGVAAAGIGAAWGFASGVAQSIDSDRRNGILGWDSIGSAYINGLIGAGKGAVIGFGFGFAGSVATGTALAAGAAPWIVGGAVFSTGVAGVGLSIGSAVINYSQGNYATAIVDVAGSIYGASKLWSVYQGARQQGFDRAAGNARPISQEYPQLNSSGSSALTNRTSAWDQNATASIVATNQAIVQATQLTNSGQIVRDFQASGGSEGFSRWVHDLGGHTGRSTRYGNRAIQEVIRKDLANLKLNTIPEFNSRLDVGGLASKFEMRTQIGKSALTSRQELVKTIVHEELHLRWNKKGWSDLYHHNPNLSDVPYENDLGLKYRDMKFYATLARYDKLRGFDYKQSFINEWHDYVKANSATREDILEKHW
jgi:RHS repeat-associated protein